MNERYSDRLKKQITNNRLQTRLPACGRGDGKYQKSKQIRNIFI
jgi:hypothetical protein